MPLRENFVLNNEDNGVFMSVRKLDCVEKEDSVSSY